MIKEEINIEKANSEICVEWNYNGRVVWWESCISSRISSAVAFRAIIAEKTSEWKHFLEIDFRTVLSVQSVHWAWFLSLFYLGLRTYKCRLENPIIHTPPFQKEKNPLRKSIFRWTTKWPSRAQMHKLPSNKMPFCDCDL